MLYFLSGIQLIHKSILLNIFEGNTFYNHHETDLRSVTASYLSKVFSTGKSSLVLVLILKLFNHLHYHFSLNEMLNSGKHFIVFCR